MATRSIVRIIPRNTEEQENNLGNAPKYIYLYHHWDGSPSGVGRELEYFLRGRNDVNDADGQPTWDANRIAQELMHTIGGYIKSEGNEGDLEYGYIIDCAQRTLKCYDLEHGKLSIDNANELVVLL